jgi:DNA-binding transcriptional LysR family regulator
MDTQNLKAFMAVAQLQSFSAAAAQLHLTQPAISKRIAALEADLEQQLFHRINRRVELTAAGQVLLSRARLILQTLEDTRRAMSDLSADVCGELKVATSHHVGLHKLPPLLRQFVASYPKVNLRFEFLDSEVAYARVLKGDCELAVVTLATEAYPNIISQALWDDPLCFVANPSLAQSLAPSLEALSRAPAILPDTSTFTGRLVKACFDERGLPLNITMTTNYLETIKMLVSVGLGWSLLPQTLLDAPLQALPVPVRIHRQLGVVTHAKRELSKAAFAFIALLRQSAAGA